MYKKGQQVYSLLKFFAIDTKLFCTDVNGYRFSKWYKKAFAFLSVEFVRGGPKKKPVFFESNENFGTKLG
jgi:hypothetical protein